MFFVVVAADIVIVAVFDDFVVSDVVDVVVGDIVIIAVFLGFCCS